MDESIVSPVLATGVLTLVATALVLVVAVEIRSATALRVFVSEHWQRLALAVAAIATLGSLYYSEMAHFTPCEFCWYQRIAMYPLAVILFIAVVTRDRIRPRYTLSIAAIGLLLSIYHYQMQLFPEQATVCTGPVSCTARFVDEFGFVTIPFMAGASFLSVLLIHLARWRSNLHLDYERGGAYDAGE